MLEFDTIQTPDKLEKDLRPYQEKAVRYIIDNPINITEICTGAGKTVIAAEVIRRIAMPTLFVVDRNILLAQTVKEFEQHFDSVGTITEGEIVNGDIMVASIQSLISLLKGDKKPMVSQLLTRFGVVMVDEAHGAKAKSYQKLFKTIAAKYRIGLSGTPYSDGNDSLELYKSFGFPEFKIRARDLIDDGYLVDPKIAFLRYDPGFVVNGDYHEIYDQLLKSEDRLDKMYDIVKNHKEENILIMADKLEHIDIIGKFIGKNTYIITGSTKKKDRQAIIDIFLKSKSNIFSSL